LLLLTSRLIGLVALSLLLCMGLELPVLCVLLMAVLLSVGIDTETKDASVSSSSLLSAFEGGAGGGVRFSAFGGPGAVFVPGGPGGVRAGIAGGKAFPLSSSSSENLTCQK
jgi:hypothetical protein